MMFYQNGSTGDWERHFWITATNRGNYKRLIQKPTFETTNYVDGKNFFSILDVHDKNKYPFPLEPGEQYTYSSHESGWLEIKEKGVNHIRIIVTDTHGKDYKSDWISI